MYHPGREVGTPEERRQFQYDEPGVMLRTSFKDDVVHTLLGAALNDGSAGPNGRKADESSLQLYLAIFLDSYS